MYLDVKARVPRTPMPSKINHAEFVKGVIDFPFGRVKRHECRRKGLHRPCLGATVYEKPARYDVTDHLAAKWRLLFVHRRITRVTSRRGKHGDGVANSRRAEREEGPYSPLPSLTHCRGRCSSVSHPLLLLHSITARAERRPAIKEKKEAGVPLDRTSLPPPMAIVRLRS